MKWAKPPFEQLVNYLTEADTLLQLCIYGLHNTSRAVPLVEALADLERFQNPDADPDLQKKSIATAREQAEFAQAEIDRGFPLLHAHTVVGTWGALESTILDFLVVWISNEPDALKAEPFSKIRISLAEFQALESDERLRLLVDELERSLRSRFKAGLSRFEALLSAIGLSGPVDQEVRKTLYEMFHVRNVIVHRASKADRRFVDACPWLGYSVGEIVVVSHEDWVRYRQAIVEYVAAVILRVPPYFEARGKASGDAAV